MPETDQQRLEKYGVPREFWGIVADRVFLHWDRKCGKWIENDEDLIIQRPEDLIGHQKSWALSLASMERESWFEYRGDDTAVMPRNRRGAVAGELLSASPYYWLSDVVDRVWDDLEKNPLLNCVVTRELFPGGLMWWCFEHNLCWGEESVDSALLIPCEDRLLVIALLSKGGAKGVAASMLYWGQSLVGARDGLHGDGLRGREHPDAYDASFEEFILSLGIMLESKYIPKSHRNVRTRKGESATKYKRSVWVDLRAIEQIPGVTHDEEGIEIRGFDHRWMVRGHIRNQWYASTEEHRPIFVSPHIKGPQGAPLIIKPYRVMR